MSFKGEVVSDSSGQWCSNSLRFATHKEALQYVTDLRYRWTAVTEVRVTECADEVNYEWRDGRSHPLITGGPI